MISGALVYRLLLSPGPRSVEDWRAYCRSLLRTLGLDA